MAKQSVDIILKAKDQASKKFSKVGKSAGGLQKKLMALGAAAGAYLGVRALKQYVEGAMESIDVTAKFATRVGMTTEGLIRLRYAAGLTGVEISGFDKALEKMVKRLGAAALSGKGKIIELIENMGLEVEHLVEQDPAKTFTSIADAISNVPNKTHQAAIAFEIFGKSGMSLVNMFDLGAKGLTEMGKKADYLGITFNNVDAAKVEEANDAISNLKQAFTGLAQGLAIDLSDSITKGSESITKFVVGTRDKIKKWIDEAGGMEKIIEKIKDALDKLWEVAKYAIPALVGAKVIAGFAGVVTGIKLATAAMNPYTVAIGAAAVAAGLFYSNHKKIKGVKDQVREAGVDLNPYLKDDKPPAWLSAFSEIDPSGGMISGMLKSKYVGKGGVASRVSDVSAMNEKVDAEYRAMMAERKAKSNALIEGSKKGGQKKAIEEEAKELAKTVTDTIGNAMSKFQMPGGASGGKKVTGTLDWLLGGNTANLIATAKNAWKTMTTPGPQESTHTLAARESRFMTYSRGTPQQKAADKTATNTEKTAKGIQELIKVVLKQPSGSGGQATVLLAANLP